MRRYILLSLIFVFTGSICAKVIPAPIFSDHAVLQCGEPVRIWGTAAPGERVCLTFAGQNVKTKADLKGSWMIVLDSMLPSHSGRELVIEGSDSIVRIQDILVGEVWLAGGQSNMATIMRIYEPQTIPDIESANDDALRMVTIARTEYEGQGADLAEWKTSGSGGDPGQPLKWKKSQPNHVRRFSASAYYFAKQLRESLGIPVGIVSCSVGGSPAEAWMSRSNLSSRADFQRILHAYDQHVKSAYVDEDDYIKKAEAYEAAFAAFWENKNDKKNRPPKPNEVMGPRYYRRPCGLYENMLKQVLPYTVKGVIWYQGEANAKYAANYGSIFSSLIDEWRGDFKNKDLPFLFVQLATFGTEKTKSFEWPELRETQRWVEENVSNTAMAVLVDGGEQHDIHPHSKDKVGDRLALLARHLVYGEELVCRGPRLQEVVLRAGRIELTFSDTGKGLFLKSSENQCFEICGDDGHYVLAKAECVDGKIHVYSDAVKSPRYVRYGWRKWFAPTLYNCDGLPASPFRTDDFKFETQGRYYLDYLQSEGL